LLVAAWLVAVIVPGVLEEALGAVNNREELNASGCRGPGNGVVRIVADCRRELLRPILPRC